MAATSRTIDKVVPATNTGKITRLIGTVDVDGAGTEHPLSEADPFILLDTAVIAKNRMPPFGAHPHRGHSVVTILLQGKVQSWDSFRRDGNLDVIQAPASYWVDAGSGLFHDEISVIEDESDPTQHMHIFQLWVGVKEEDRKKPPRVQYDRALPHMVCLDAGGSEVGKSICFVGDKTEIETPHPIEVVHITQKAGTTYRVPMVPTHGGFVVTMKGNASFGGTTPEQENDVLVLACTDDSNGPGYLEVTTTSDAAQYLVCTGERIQEPWAKKLVASGAVIAATPGEARALAPKVEAMSHAGKAEGGSFAPFGM